jgi:sulfur relay (sulfurtransferase) complex TusBCD TusD component (DsrE family)
MGVKVLACGVCTSARGLEEKELLAGVPVVSMVDLGKSIKESSRVLVF